MNTQEHEQLTRFLQQLKEAKVGAKDAEAEKLIREAVGQQADADYLLVQRNLLLGQALDNAQAEIARLRRELEISVPGKTGFLDGNAWGNRPAAPSPGAASFPPPAQAAPATGSSWGTGILGSVATTAAGVVAGSFLFQGIEHLMGHHNSSSGFLSGHSTMPDPVAPAENLSASNFSRADSAADDFADMGPSDSDPDWV